MESKKKKVSENRLSEEDADIENGLEDTGEGKGNLGKSERVALTYIQYPM